MVDSSALPDQPGVEVNDEGGARAAAEHLLGLGHRDILVVGRRAARPRAQPDLRRRHGAPDARLPWRPSRRRGIDLPAERGRRRARRASRAASPPCAAPGRTASGRPRVLAMSDAMAIGVLRAARELGLRVPEDLSRRRLRRHRHQPAHEPAVDHGAPADPPEGRERGAPAPVRRRTTGSTPRAAPAGDAAHRPRLHRARAAQAAGGGPGPKLRTRGGVRTRVRPACHARLTNVRGTSDADHGSRAGPGPTRPAPPVGHIGTNTGFLWRRTTQDDTKIRLVSLARGRGDRRRRVRRRRCHPGPARPRPPRAARPRPHRGPGHRGPRGHLPRG